MVTVKQFKESGFKLVGGDTVGGVKINESQASSANSYNSNILALDFYITDFIWRKNTGVQPVGDDCWVEVELKNGLFHTRKAIDFAWSGIWGITHWKPSLKHLEQQMNADDYKKIKKSIKAFESKFSMNDNQETKTALEMSERDIENFEYDYKPERELKESNEVVWGSGDIAIHEGHEVLVIDWHPHHPLLVVEGGNGFFATSSDKLSKPETPEQKAARERNHAVDLMLSDAGYLISTNDLDTISKPDPNFDVIESMFKLYDAGYRKQ